MHMHVSTYVYYNAAKASSEYPATMVFMYNVVEYLLRVTNRSFS